MKSRNIFIITSFISILFSFTNCSREMEGKNKKIIIPLKTVSHIKKAMIYPVSFLDNKDIPKGYRKEVIGDSVRIGYKSFITDEELTSFLEKNRINQQALDTVNRGIYFITGIKDGKQFLSADLNYNWTFKDDEIYIFSTDVTYKTKTNFNLDSLFPTQEIVVTKFSGSHFYKDTLFAKIYPNYNYFGYPKMDDNIRLKKRLQLALHTTDNFLGTFSHQNETYKVTVSKSKNLRNQIRFANDENEFSLEFYLRYQIKDTIQIANDNFLIDTLMFAPNKLVLKPIEIEDKEFGYKVGSKLNKYFVDDLKGNNVSLKKLANKKLLLLDFWGTWCAPCIELTPDLKEISKKYKSKLNIVSLAYQEDVEPVKEYVSKNNMDWFNGIIVKGSPKTFYEKRKIIRELRVKTFPTFILVDESFNIIFRNSGGGENFEKLVEVIDKYDLRDKI